MSNSLDYATPKRFRKRPGMNIRTWRFWWFWHKAMPMVSAFFCGMIVMLWLAGKFPKMASSDVSFALLVCGWALTGADPARWMIRAWRDRHKAVPPDLEPLG